MSAARIMFTRGNVDVWAWVCDVAIARRGDEGWHVRDYAPKPPLAPMPYTLTCDDRVEHGCCENNVFGRPLPAIETQPANEGATT